jgi:hypothetical protein
MLLPATVSGQVDAGYLGVWEDLEVSSSYDATLNRTTAALAIVPAGPALTLVFEAEIAGRLGSGSVTSLEVSAYPGVLATATVPRPLFMRFVIDAGTESALPLFFHGNDWGVYGFVPAGGEVLVVRAVMFGPELQALALAKSISGEALGHSFSFSAEQIAALESFARMVFTTDEGVGTP